ncbi:MAG: CDP-alcohol phosphatidyltransferase family protein [Anaerolineae bacterium]
MTSQKASIYRWTRQHAFLVFALFIIAIIQKSTFLIGIGGLLSFLLFIIQHPVAETENGDLPFWQSPPNLITLIRVFTVSAIAMFHPLLHPIAVGLIGVNILITDYFDGYLSRKLNKASLFGAQFDQESDAFYIGVYSLLLYVTGYAGVWIVTLGILRYLYVIALFLLNQQHKKEARIRGARIVAVMVMIALLVPYILPPLLYLPYLILCTACLLYSFGYAFILQINLPEEA